MATPRMRALGSALLVAATACGGSGESPPPASSPSFPAPPGLVGEVSFRPGSGPASAEGIGVRLVPADAMTPFVERRLEQARAELSKRRADMERLRPEVDRLRQENDQANGRWLKARDLDLRRRVELQLRAPRTPEERRALQDRFLSEKRMAWDRAVRVAREADEKERALQALGRAVPWREGAYFLEGLPPAARVAWTDRDGRFQVALDPGVYAVVAAAPSGPDGGEPRTWLVWATVASGRQTRIRLGDDNLLGTDCADCVVATRALVP